MAKKKNYMKDLLMMVKSWLVSKPVKEAVKEFFRVIAVAVLPVIYTGLEAGGVDWRVVATVGVVAGLKSLDKFIHQTGKEAKNENLIKGLTRF